MEGKKKNTRVGSMLSSRMPPPPMQHAKRPPFFGGKTSSSTPSSERVMWGEVESSAWGDAVLVNGLWLETSALGVRLSTWRWRIDRGVLLPRELERLLLGRRGLGLGLLASLSGLLLRRWERAQGGVGVGRSCTCGTVRSDPYPGQCVSAYTTPIPTRCQPTPLTISSAH